MVPDGAVNDPSFMVKFPDIVRVELEAVTEPVYPALIVK